MDQLVGSLLNYLRSGEASAPPTYSNTTTALAIVQKNTICNHQGTKQCDDAKQPQQKVDVSNEKREPTTKRTSTRILVVVGAVVVAAGAGTAYLLKDYFRGSGPSEDTPQAGPSENQDSAASSKNQGSASSSDTKAREPDSQDTDGDKAEDGDQSEDGDQAEKDCPDQESDSGSALYTKYMYEHITSERKTANGRIVTKHTTCVANSEVVTIPGSGKAKGPEQASPASAQDSASLRSEQRKLARSIQDMLRPAGQRRAGV